MTRPLARSGNLVQALTNPKKLREGLEFHTRRLFLSNPLRRAQIEALQTSALEAQSWDRHRAIVFFTPGYDRVDGGLLSIASLVAETKRLTSIHNASVFACPFPSEPPVAAYTQFDNELQPLNYRQLARRLSAKRSELLLHIPECYVPQVRHLCLDRLVAAGVSVQINILLQNIDMAPSRAEMDALKRYAPVTVTTAHKAYATRDVADRIGAPIHHLSVWLCPERFTVSPLSAKRNLVLMSPDDHPQRQAVIDRLRQGLPNFEFVVVRNMAYREYRALCSAAKLAITFGEGLDGYYIEGIFSGGISAAVYNDRFFTPKYRNLPLMYSDWPELAERLPTDFRARLDEADYVQTNREQFEVTASDYRHDEYVGNLRRFYQEAITWSEP